MTKTINNGFIIHYDESDNSTIQFLTGLHFDGSIVQCTFWNGKKWATTTLGRFLLKITDKSIICEHEDIFCVHHDKLKEYGIITEGRSDKIKRCLDQFEMILNKDYVCLTLSDIKSYNSRFKCPTLGHLK